MELLKRCSLYLLHSPRVIQMFRRQRILTRLDVYSDSDHAGCIRTRKSTSGCVIMAGCNLLKSVCRGQAVVALSSGAAMSSRRGLGRVKHVHTAFLWIQNYVTNGLIKLTKKHTSENLADILTKPVTATLMVQMMDLMGFRYVAGRSKIAFAV